MLLALTEYLARFYSGFHVFQYLTLRGILAAVTALAMALFIGPTMIEMLSRYQIGQRAVGRPQQPLRVDTARDHARIRIDRLLRRLSEAGGGQFEGPAGPLQVCGAIAGGGRHHHDAAPSAPVPGGDLAVRPV